MTEILAMFALEKSVQELDTQVILLDLLGTDSRAVRSTFHGQPRSNGVGIQQNQLHCRMEDTIWEVI